MATSYTRKIKDPDSTVDYTLNWAGWLGADTISGSTWTAETGLTVDSDSFTATTATARVTSGTHGHKYLLTNRITTTAGQTEDRTLEIVVDEK